MNREIKQTGGYQSLFRARGAQVVVQDIKKSYGVAAQGRIDALFGVSLEANPHEVVAIMGVSGCGKTTLLNLIGGVDVPDSGVIRVGEWEISSLDQRALESYRLRHVGFIFQSYNLIPSLTAVKNLEFPMTIARVMPKERRERAYSLLEIVGIRDQADKRPDELSGGEQQRVAIGVSLSNDPALILADEPTANLDRGNAQIVSELLLTLAEELGKTVVICTHDPRVADIAHRKMTMDSGRMINVAAASPQGVVSHEGAGR